jgi:2-oxo-4-hydroxy-4-carboxy-5-ureidoimidazoline decarboxylase
MTTRITPLTVLNELPLNEFAVALRPLFEAADPLAQTLREEGPFASYEHLVARAEALAAQMPLAQKIEVLNAHPRIGERPERVSRMSFREQGYAAETELPADDLHQIYAALEDLNRVYEERFGFRFVVFVNGRPKAAILEVLKGRLNNSRDKELRTGLQEMFLIARDRLSQLDTDC